MTDYQQQAVNFLSETGTHFIAEFKKFGKYFPDDKHPRNIFTITLANSSHKYTFTFGSSLRDSLENCDTILHEDCINFFAGLKFDNLKYKYLSFSAKIKISELKNGYKINNDALAKIYYEWVNKNTSRYDAPKYTLNAFEAYINEKLAIKIRSLKENNWGEGKQNPNIIPPTPYDVLSCLEKYPIHDFADFCNNYGYDEDSRKAFKIYKSTKREWENVNKLFTAPQIELLREIQ